MMNYRNVLCLLGIGLIGVGLCFADPASSASKDPALKEALQKLNGIIGAWRGTGQPRRGSNNGAWRENAEFVWDFTGDAPAIKYVVNDGKLTAMARMTYDAAAKKYVVQLERPDGTNETLAGNWDGGRLVCESDGEGEQQRLTITPLNEKRTLVLFESRPTPEGTFHRIAEVGYTRAGTRLALPGGGQPECIVTGGAASTPVMYKGKTYYVCCTGCKQAFEDDPEGIIADAEERIRKARESLGN